MRLEGDWLCLKLLLPQPGTEDRFCVRSYHASRLVAIATRAVEYGDRQYRKDRGFELAGCFEGACKFNRDPLDVTRVWKQLNQFPRDLGSA